ncbi:lysophospholipase L1-like esterase [Ruminiclostridium sufflavum DSM 19573]|uniref:Lysophospholipase L1-like esterase n=1 Tax=Ruminiclostridium sufflavum DSM 19573 TaxID=1121337 RepID=A0A318XJP1_9FIRM|nr:GDSL-type esterase/lipase family protein [Ruminiclostridium sufflavum]PYG87444.1 lysophospholipase L1-like esterase [Ruminiclostridium sufflavum DSM 19573]
MKKMKEMLSIVLGIASLIGVSLPAYAPNNVVEEIISTYIPVNEADGNSTYVALGDSITTGYGLESFDGNDIENKSSEKSFVNKLGNKLGKEAVNLGIDGIDSTRFLQVISNPVTEEQQAVISQIENAGIITISIGGNDVFLALAEVLNGKLGEGRSIFNATKQEILKVTVEFLFNKSAKDSLKEKVSAATETFVGNPANNKEGNFADIIKAVKKLNPDAQIIVQTIYKPYDLQITSFCNTAIEDMNAKIIKDSENGKNYLVADVYSAFEKAGSETALINADSGKTFDPHPTAKGHEVIYTVIAAALQNNTLPYRIKASIVNGKLTDKVLDGELILTVTPEEGYKVPKNISVAIGSDAKKTLAVDSNGKAAMPVADIGTDIAVSGICSN